MVTPLFLRLQRLFCSRVRERLAGKLLGHPVAGSGSPGDANAGLESDEVQRRSAPWEMGRINPVIKGGQFASMLHGEGEKVEVGEVRGSREVRKGVGIREGKVVGPELVAGSGSKGV